MTLTDRVSARLDLLFAQGLPCRLAVAVSGGGDSLALLHLAHSWAQKRGVTLVAMTVDHALRTESAQEAQYVGTQAEKLGIEHHILTWGDWDNQGNLQDKARQARRALIEKCGTDRRIDAVLTGHTADDQAETLLMRLARGSGVDGLTGMAAIERHGLTWVRPLLDERRLELRSYLQNLNISWIDDPSNEDSRFDRVRARKMMVQLADLGLTTERLVQTANHMRAAERSLWQASHSFAKAHVTQDRGDLVLSDHVLNLDRSDTERRVFAEAIRWVSGENFRPRFKSLIVAAKALQAGNRTTLQGVLITPTAKGIRFSREASAIVNTQSAIVAASGAAIWDQRWCIEHDGQTEQPTGLVVRALGAAGLMECDEWRAVGLPRDSLLASPAIWQEERLISAPLAGLANGWQADIVMNFTDRLLSH